ncbi:hypothetical protein M5W68_20575 [Paenibacillus larvae]|uniref:hypothetical protein n=1 Tax=Paenibacillus larvae TaxID=1464 RepID=UPI002281B31D|nr:hypothetical protein [Paenibacillus larvae]MCY9508549.1 hypothetical protein [Paenibacillus larvae]MCY9527424.1 hypothetical protein [Paenibacillus larvae]
MNDKSSKGGIGKVLSLIYPSMIALVCTTIAIKYKVTYKLPNFDKVLDGSITFSSIVVGFLGALLGILISIKDSEIVDKIFRSNERTTLKIFFYEPFLLGVFVVVTSAFMHVLRAYDTLFSGLIFYIWLFLTIWFFPSTFRVVNTFMSVFFVSNKSSVRPKSNVETDPFRRQELKERLKKSKNEVTPKNVNIRDLKKDTQENSKHEEKKE